MGYASTRSETRTKRRKIAISTSTTTSMARLMIEPSGQLRAVHELVLDQVAVHDAFGAAHQQRRHVFAEGGDEDEEEAGQHAGHAQAAA